MSLEARERSFDELARGLASDTLPRGKALKLMGAALVGGVLASIPGMAQAAPFPKPGGFRCKIGSQCQSELCLPSGVCSGFPITDRGQCPKTCDPSGTTTSSPVILADGSIGCQSCPPGGCQVSFATDCGGCGDLLCFPYNPSGDMAFACVTPCTAA